MTSLIAFALKELWEVASWNDFQLPRAAFKLLRSASA